MRPVAFLTTDRLDDFVTYDHLAVAPLAARGWAVDVVPWRADVDWGRWEAVVVRSPWDYQADPDAFLEVLDAIDASPARLANPLGVMRWNLDKRYLRDVSARGVPIVPTAWGRGLDAARLDALRIELASDEIVVKPVVGANADDTFRLPRTADASDALAAFPDRAWMAQPFVQSIVDVGETSVFVFGGAPSHAVLKTPAQGDFRVQEEHGGTIRPVPLTPDLLAISERVLHAVEDAGGGGLLYARVDVVALADGSWAVIEVELIEPSLYFPYDADSPARFADAFVAWMDAGM